MLQFGIYRGGVWVYIWTKEPNYYKSLRGIIAMVLKWLYFTCPTNRKTDPCMGKGKKVSE